MRGHTIRDGTSRREATPRAGPEVNVDVSHGKLNNRKFDNGGGREQVGEPDRIPTPFVNPERTIFDFALQKSKADKL